MTNQTNLTFKVQDGSFTYRAAAIIVKNKKLLMAKSTDAPRYYTVGGRVSLHESSDEAVLREVYEETGQHAEIVRLFCLQERFMTLNTQRYHEIVLFYLMKVGDDFHIHDGTATDQPLTETLHWIPLVDISTANIVPPLLKTFDYENLPNFIHVITRENE